MNVAIIGGGPGGLYTAILLARSDPSRQITVYERNRADDTFGFGVVFSDRTMEGFAAADPESHAAITAEFAHWDDIDTWYQGQCITSAGHGFAGMGRMRLLQLMQERAAELGVTMRWETEVESLDAIGLHDLLVLADGVNSRFRDHFADRFQPTIDWRPNRFVWLGTTFPFGAFTFYFRENEHGLFRVHAYRYAEDQSTFIVECTEDTWQRAGFDQASEDDTVAYCEQLFAAELQGHRLLKNRSLWRQFPTITCGHWAFDNTVLIGDAVHTAHFSIGSGTKLAMEDAIALVDAIDAHPGDVPTALQAYEAERRSVVASIQRAAQVSLEWFEDTERYFGTTAPEPFVFSMLTRSMRITHANLRQRDAEFVDRCDRWLAGHAAEQTGQAVSDDPPPPPMFTPFRVRNCVLPNRVVVSPMSMYSATDGLIDDFHLVHLGSRAMGGAGLVIAEMTHVAPDARITPGCAGLWNEQQRDAWQRVVDHVHAHTPAKIALQIGHAGRKGATHLMWDGMDRPLPADQAWPIVSASPLPYLPESQTPAELDRAGMERVTAEHVRAAELAAEAGFDWLEVHCAHGYLLSSFLSPLTNVRTDDYGGSLENRLRYPLEVIAAVRAAWPADRPLSARISATDWAPGGLSHDDAVAIARAFHAAGADVIDVSAGQVVADQRPVYGRLFQTPFSDRVRHEGPVPTITVGNVSSWDDANSIVLAGRADLVALARGHLYDPYWTRHAARAQGYELPWPKQYASVKSFTPRDPS